MTGQKVRLIDQKVRLMDQKVRLSGQKVRLTGQKVRLIGQKVRLTGQNKLIVIFNVSLSIIECVLGNPPFSSKPKHCSNKLFNPN